MDTIFAMWRFENNSNGIAESEGGCGSSGVQYGGGVFCRVVKLGVNV